MIAASARLACRVARESVAILDVPVWQGPSECEAEPVVVAIKVQMVKSGQQVSKDTPVSVESVFFLGISLYIAQQNSSRMKTTGGVMVVIRMVSTKLLSFSRIISDFICADFNFSSA